MKFSHNYPTVSSKAHTRNPTVSIQQIKRLIYSLQMSRAVCCQFRDTLSHTRGLRVPWRQTISQRCRYVDTSKAAALQQEHYRPIRARRADWAHVSTQLQPPYVGGTWCQFLPPIVFHWAWRQPVEIDVRNSIRVFLLSAEYIRITACNCQVILNHFSNWISRKHPTHTATLSHRPPSRVSVRLCKPSCSI